MMRVLVTGAEGFVGSHLLPYLLKQGMEAIAAAMFPERMRMDVPTHRLDITKENDVHTVFHAVQPTHVIHLAAVSSVRESFKNPDATHDVNVQGTQHLLDAALSLPTPPIVLLIGSGDEYGLNDGQPLSECSVTDLAPVSPYGKSKKAVEELVEGNERYRAIAIRTRSFPHIGPGQKGRFFIPEVTEQLMRIERGEQSGEIGVGNLTAVRDFSDVRDVIRAYVLLLKKGNVGDVYNVCSGQGIPIADLLNTLLSISGIKVKIAEDLSKIRPADIPVQVGKNEKIRRVTGWEPHIPLEQTLRDILAVARAQNAIGRNA